MACCCTAATRDQGSWRSSFHLSDAAIYQNKDSIKLRLACRAERPRSDVVRKEKVHRRFLNLLSGDKIILQPQNHKTRYVGSHNYTKPVTLSPRRF
jgi:hypothetical protein